VTDHLDPLDPVTDLLMREPGLDDRGFTDRVLAALPPRRRDPRPLVLGAAGLAAAAIGAASLPAALEEAAGALASLAPAALLPPSLLGSSLFLAAMAAAGAAAFAGLSLSRGD